MRLNMSELYLDQIDKILWQEEQPRISGCQDQEIPGKFKIIPCRERYYQSPWPVYPALENMIVIAE
jgi:hypothetical protein